MRLRKFMIKVRNSNKLLEDLQRIFESQSIEFLSPQLDISTRWNSTFLMINKMIQIKVQANMLITQHSNEFTNIHFDDNDWKNLNKLVSVLSPFYSATLTLSSSIYSIIGDLCLTFWTLIQHLQYEILVNQIQYLLADSILQKLNEY
ncbi:hypothetical protein RirG_147240 [Rhizophagus irregularis DAOM 197198w]|uniref:Uncharacterized protein n=1 Tax=Rhizophagus irregularis (strain DAOM 197198w) TaxID=1432141 RepID=A0A015MAV7_RHIIW|nr:hypothetical protein RirG_147240 [Rhizophagus irregularis DAOM 197198w]